MFKAELQTFNGLDIPRQTKQLQLLVLVSVLELRFEGLNSRET